MTGWTDVRKEIDSLATLGQNDYQLNPFEKNLFLLCGSRFDRFKALYWDGQGFWLLYKRAMNRAIFIGLNRRSH
ncbi:IS66 family insertion sequence element accessory protein TnpB [Globicatella sp. PHS-GS-PNBC-21-1553]|uniref:IS66 family insertion sequence element accessory protein TnpB n=1 Tax=Globicatella sp. PHS-GS-PNBC-21-1553 TaxID=2885764 RepID=UPI002B2A8044|nr:IS66 family insertion sequence element accessory protein TnpB [Globicatella sp. PHS-GS-PNBC-21-1553]